MCVIGLVVGYGVYLLKIIMMFELSIFWIFMFFFGLRKMCVLLVGEVKVMFCLVILWWCVSENIWKLLELVRIGLF